METKASTNSPKKRFQKNRVRAAVWENHSKDGGKYHSVHIDRSYFTERDADGKPIWKDNRIVLRGQELDDLQKVLEDVTRFVAEEGKAS